jgi:hypothetical protein
VRPLTKSDADVLLWTGQNSVNAETTGSRLEIENVRSALSEAHQRLDAAKQLAASEQGRANALQLKAKLAEFEELGLQVDEAIVGFGHVDEGDDCRAH